MDIPFSIDIARRWSAGGWIYRFLFSLRSNSTPLECGSAGYTVFYRHSTPLECGSAGYTVFYRHSTPLECGRLDIPFSIDIARRWSAGGWVYRFLFSLRSNSTPLECGSVDIPFSIDIARRWSAGAWIYRFL